jgi:hypothetical protein
MGWLTHVVDVTLETIYVSGPEATERSQPGIHFLEWFRFEPLEIPPFKPRPRAPTGPPLCSMASPNSASAD